MKTYICEFCKKEHDGSYGSGRFCSKSCRSKYGASKMTKHICNFKKGPSSKAKGNWKCIWCEEIFRTKRELQNHKHEKHPEYSSKEKAWNKGLTKETNDSVKRTSEKIKDLYSTKKYKDLFKNKTFSIETRKKLSESASKRHSDPNKQHGRPDVKWYKIKNLNGYEYSVKGTWELHVAERLNKLGILWVRNIQIKYMNEYEHTYIPDFFLPNTNEFIEVKGWFSKNDKIKMNLVISQFNDIKIRFIDKSVYNNFINEKISFDQIPFYKIIKLDDYIPIKNISQKSYFNNRIKCKAEKEEERKHKIEIAKVEGRFKNGKILGNALSINEWNNRKEMILSSGVDLMKFGWIRKIKEKTGLTTREIENTINHFEKDFEGKFFKRK